MTRRILLAGVLGGFAMFLWEGLAHEALPLGRAGIRGLNHEAEVVAALKANIAQPGFYIFPGGEVLEAGLSGEQKKEAMRKAMEQWRLGPAGIMVVHPEGINPESPRQLATQCILDIASALLAAFLLSLGMSRSTYGRRVLFITVIGLLPTLNAELPYWNWYGFPGAFALAQATTHVVGFFFAGLVIAKLVDSPVTKSPATA
jgi:hypothetical protein